MTSFTRVAVQDMIVVYEGLSFDAEEAHIDQEFMHAAIAAYRVSKGEDHRYPFAADVVERH